MKLGIITDVHEHVEHLEYALRRFRREHVDQVVFIGDLCQTGERLEETCRLLDEADAIGVWGNHDYAFCVDPPEQLRGKYSDAVFRTMARLRPTLEIDDCLFTHVEPWLNPMSLFDLWYYDGPPDEHGKLDRIFRSVPNRIMFVGHFHKWLLATENEITEWHGERMVSLARGRYFVVIGAVCDGAFAIFDTKSSELTPLREIPPIKVAAPLTFAESLQ